MFGSFTPSPIFQEVCPFSDSTEMEHPWNLEKSGELPSLYALNEFDFQHFDSICGVKEELSFNGIELSTEEQEKCLSTHQSDSQETCAAAQQEEKTTEEITNSEEATDSNTTVARGRPRKNITITTAEFYQFLTGELKKNMRKINAQAKSALNQERTDTVRTSLIRLIKKIPYISLIKLARRADYKARSNETHRFLGAYQLTISKFVEMLDLAEVEHCLSPSSPEGFTSLYFPKQKVVDTATDKELAQKLLRVRDATSVKEIKALNSLDPTFKTLLGFTIKLSEESNFRTLTSILKSLNRQL